MLAIVNNRMVTVSRTRYEDAHCFVCGRHTDHWGEHDDLVELGQALNESRRWVWGDTLHISGDVVPTDAFYTPAARAEREVLYAATDHMITTSITGRVSLLKPVGEVITYRHRQALAA